MLLNTMGDGRILQILSALNIMLNFYCASVWRDPIACTAANYTYFHFSLRN